MTPISPRSLSFRPILLPKDATGGICENVVKDRFLTVLLLLQLQSLGTRKSRWTSLGMRAHCLTEIDISTLFAETLCYPFR
jgi:hypothetical protein